MIFEAEQKWGTSHAVPNCCKKPIPKFHFLTLPNPDHWVHNKWKIINLLKVESRIRSKIPQLRSHAYIPISSQPMYNLCSTPPLHLSTDFSHLSHPQLTPLLASTPHLLTFLPASSTPLAPRLCFGRGNTSFFLPPPPPHNWSQQNHRGQKKGRVGDRRKEE